MTRKRANGKRASTGRIPAHLRDTDDTTLTITGEDICPEHAAAIFTTTDQGTTEGVRRNYRSRNRTVIKWLWENYPQAAELSTRCITTKEKSNPHLYYYPQDEYDFVYSGLNPKYTLLKGLHQRGCERWETCSRDTTSTKCNNVLNGIWRDVQWGLGSVLLQGAVLCKVLGHANWI